jgi:hypothetical protein
MLRPRPVGWTSKRDQLRDLLRRVLIAFDLKGAQVDLGLVSTQRRTFAQAGVPEGREYLRRYNVELRLARDTLRGLLLRVEELRGPTLQRPNEYSALWHGIIEDWNTAVLDGPWLTLPTLCEACGRPVLLRGTGRGPSLSCSDGCRHVLRACEAKQRKARRAKRKGSGSV